jgi:hypothetical protein
MPNIKAFDLAFFYINDGIVKNPPQTLLSEEDYKQNKQIKP